MYRGKNVRRVKRKSTETSLIIKLYVFHKHPVHKHPVRLPLATCTEFKRESKEPGLRWTKGSNEGSKGSEQRHGARTCLHAQDVYVSCNQSCHSSKAEYAAPDPPVIPLSLSNFSTSTQPNPLFFATCLHKCAACVCIAWSQLKCSTVVSCWFIRNRVKNPILFELAYLQLWDLGAILELDYDNFDLNLASNSIVVINFLNLVLYKFHEAFLISWLNL